MKRSKWKGPFFEYSLKQKLKNLKPTQILKTTERSSVILPSFINKFISIYNGCRFLRLLVRPEMVGHKIGSFVPTRKKPIHKRKKRK